MSSLGYSSTLEYIIRETFAGKNFDIAGLATKIQIFFDTFEYNSDMLSDVIEWIQDCPKILREGCIPKELLYDVFSMIVGEYLGATHHNELVAMRKARPDIIIHKIGNGGLTNEDLEAKMYYQWTAKRENREVCVNIYESLCGKIDLYGGAFFHQIAVDYVLDDGEILAIG
jgi:hypothetical protein